MNRDVLISRYSHLNKLPREKEAIFIIKKVASMVKPIMRARSWRVGTLAEFLPKEPNLLGINMNHGERICLRLRYARDNNQFLPFEQIVDTMLHELCHNVIGPHNVKFHALWDQLRLEYQNLIKKGYTGEGFLSEGYRLGGRKSALIFDAREIARRAAFAAEQRQRQNKALKSCEKFGLKAIPLISDMRDFLVDAIQRRMTILDGCGAEKRNAREIEDLAVQATQNGFTSQAEEDEANERAISQALWELVQEDLAKQKKNPNFSANKNTHKDSTSNTALSISRSGWNCPTCTFHNPVSFLACDACNLERPFDITRLLASK